MATTTITDSGAHAAAAATDRIPALKTPFTPGTKGYLTPQLIATYAIGSSNTSLGSNWPTALGAALGSGWTDFLPDNITGIIARTKTEWRGFGGAFDSSGASGNGTELSTLIQSAIDFCAAAGGGQVMLPPGIGRITSTIVMKDFVHLCGAGETVTGLLIDNAAVDGIWDGNASGLTESSIISDLYTYRVATSSCFAIRYYCSDKSTLRNYQHVVSGGVAGNGIALGVAGKTITAAANNGSGLIRLTATAHGFSTGCRVRVGFVAGTTEANATWTVTRITADTFDLQGSTFTNAYVSGGLVAPTVSNWYPQSIKVDYEDVGLGVYACAGGVVGNKDVSFVGRKRSGNYPASGTKGLYAPKSTSPWSRFDYITGILGLAGADKNIHIEATRWVNVELDGMILDDWRTKCVHIETTTPDGTGGGVEVFNIRGSRMGMNIAGGEQMVVVDAVGASVTKFAANGLKGTSTQTAIAITGDTATRGFSGDLDNMSIEMRLTSGTQHAVDLTGYVPDVSVNGLKATSNSSTYSGNGVNINSGATGSVVVDIAPLLNGFGGVPCSDGAAIVRGPFNAASNVKLQTFLLVLWNDAGTMKHRISASAKDGTAAPAQLISLINGASTTFTTTPTGADAGTAMAAGGKISSASTSTFILDTPTQVSANVRIAGISVGYNDSDTAIAVLGQLTLSSVNSVSRNRLSLYFRDASTGAAFDLTSAIGSGEFVYVHIDVWLTP